MKVISVIPIKTNNERLPFKNTKPLNGKPLIEYIQETLISVADINERYVYCSDDKIKDYLMHGIEFLKRPEYLDSATTNFTQIFNEFSLAKDADIYVYAHATAPFITTETFKKGLDAVVNGLYDSAFCAEKIQDFIWHDGKPVNFSADNIPRSQDLPVYYRETSGVYIFKKSVFTETKRRIGKKPFIMEVSRREAVDINNPDDFDYAEFMQNFNVKDS